MNVPYNDPYLDIEKVLDKLIGNPNNSPYWQAASTVLIQEIN